MNSLKTDDILGARPRVRHMPKNLIRQRSIPTAFLTNLQPVNPEWQNYNSPKSYEAIEHENYEPYNSPYYSRDIRSKQPQHINYDFLKNNNAGKGGQNIKSRYQSASREASQPKKYYYQPYNQQREQGYRNRPDSNSKAVQYNSQPQQVKKSDEQNRRRSEASSRKSMDSKDYKDKSEEGKKIFRGLGFNIITNHKFQYTFEHKGTPQTRF